MPSSICILNFRLSSEMNNGFTIVFFSGCLQNSDQDFSNYQTEGWFLVAVFIFSFCVQIIFKFLKIFLYIWKKLMKIYNNKNSITFMGQQFLTKSYFLVITQKTTSKDRWNGHWIMILKFLWDCIIFKKYWLLYYLNIFKMFMLY